MAIQNNSQNSQHPMAAIPQHLNPTDVANPSAVLLSPPVRKTRIQQPKPETGKFHIIQKASVFFAKLWNHLNLWGSVFKDFLGSSHKHNHYQQIMKQSLNSIYVKVHVSP